MLLADDISTNSIPMERWLIPIACRHMVLSGANWMILPFWPTRKWVQPPGDSGRLPEGPGEGVLLAKRFQGDCQVELTV